MCQAGGVRPGRLRGLSGASGPDESGDAEEDATAVAEAPKRRSAGGERTLLGSRGSAARREEERPDKTGSKKNSQTCIPETVSRSGCRGTMPLVGALRRDGEDAVIRGGGFGPPSTVRWRMGDDDVVIGIAAVVREALADPDVRVQIAELLTGTTDARRRRLETLAQELADYEVSWQRREES